MALDAAAAFAVPPLEDQLLVGLLDEDPEEPALDFEPGVMDPAYRGSRVFIQMYEKLFRYEEEHGLVSIWGFTPCSLFRRCEPTTHR